MTKFLSDPNTAMREKLIDQIILLFNYWVKKWLKIIYEMKKQVKRSGWLYKFCVQNSNTVQKLYIKNSSKKKERLMIFVESNSSVKITLMMHQLDIDGPDSPARQNDQRNKQIIIKKYRPFKICKTNRFKSRRCTRSGTM